LIKEKIIRSHQLGINIHMKQEKSKTGPKPKEMIEGTIVGLPVGRNKTVIPPDQVEELAALGCRDIEIAKFFGLSESTLRYNFQDYLDLGREHLKIKLRRALLQNACTNMNAAVQIFLAKNILGMSDQQTDAESNQPLPWNESEEIEIDQLEDEPVKDIDE